MTESDSIKANECLAFLGRYLEQQRIENNRLVGLVESLRGHESENHRLRAAMEQAERDGYAFKGNPLGRESR